MLPIVMRSDYELISRLGRGAYGVVLKAKHKEVRRLAC